MVWNGIFLSYGSSKAIRTFGTIPGSVNATAKRSKKSIIWIAAVTTTNGMALA